MATMLVAGGGTGGHIFPGIAIARAVMELAPDTRVLFVGTQRGLESRLVPSEGFELRTIRSAGITGKKLLARLRGLALIPGSLAQSWTLLGSTRPALVVGVGGYASGPVLAAAVLRRVPTLIHEQNCVPGATNRWLARWVREVAVTFEESVPRLAGRGVVTGNPVRPEFTAVSPRGVEPAARHLLIFGGSQGARAVNRAVVESLPILAGALRAGPAGYRLTVTHQTGEADLETVARAYLEAGLQADVRPFIGDMARRFEQADLIVSRSGATSVAELTAAGRPAILIPFAAAAHDHQTFNARKLADAGAALLIPERDLTGASLAAAVTGLLADPDRLARMSRASHALGRPDAARRIATLCLSLMREAA